MNPAGKKRAVRITHAGIYLKHALVQVTHVAVKSYDIRNEDLYKIPDQMIRHFV